VSEQTISKIKQHPEWAYVEEWFRSRVGRLYPASDHLALYCHVEKIAVDVVVDEAVEQAARELGYRAGESINGI
jgi:hypothetical protein